MSLKVDQAIVGASGLSETGVLEKPGSSSARPALWLVRAVSSNLRMIRTYRTVYLFAGLAVALAALAAASVGATVAALPIGLIAAIFAAAANETPTRRVFATFMPRRGQLLIGQIVTAFLLVTGVFILCSVVAAPITAAVTTSGLAAAFGSYAMGYVAALLMSSLMFFTTVVTRSAPATFGLVASGVLGVMAAAIAGSEALLALVPISATVIVGTGLAGLTLPALVALVVWNVVMAVIAIRRFRRSDFGG